MVILEQIAGIRSSIFNNSEERIAFLNTYIDGLGNIMTTKKDLQHPDNYHGLSRVLVRLKYNYQLRFLMEVNHYAEFMEKVI